MRFILIITVFLLGCAPVKDPSKSGGLVSTAINLWGGEYDARLQKRQVILSDFQTKNQQLDQDNRSLADEKMFLIKQLNIEKQKLSKIELKIKKLEKRVKNETATLKANKRRKTKRLRQLRNLKSRNKKLQRQVRKANIRNNANGIKAIQKERNLLDKELNLLIDSSL